MFDQPIQWVCDQGIDKQWAGIAVGATFVVAVRIAFALARWMVRDHPPPSDVCRATLEKIAAAGVGDVDGSWAVKTPDGRLRFWWSDGLHVLVNGVEVYEHLSRREWRLVKAAARDKMDQLRQDKLMERGRKALQ